MWKRKEKREKREFVFWDIFPSESWEAIPASGRALGCDIKLEVKQLHYLPYTRGRDASRWDQARVGDGASHRVQVLLMFKQILAPAAEPSAWPWQEPR